VARDYDHGFIDQAGDVGARPHRSDRWRAASVAAIMASNLVLVPVQPSPYDVWASADVADLINQP
jgi:chromosome partitioning protein